MKRYVCLITLAVTLMWAATSGAVTSENVTLTIVSAPQGKDAKGERSVTAQALVRRVNTSEQLKAVTLETLEHLKRTWPGCMSYSLVVSDDAKMMAIGNYLAIAVVTGEKTALTGGIPTHMDIRVMKASKVEIRKPDPLGIQATYDVAVLRKEAKQAGKPVSDETLYARVAKKHKLQPVQVKMMDREITQYYKAFAGKPF